MAEPQRIVEDIRAFLNSSEQTFRDGLKQYAQDYADACAQVNDRLRRCDDLLTRGLRSEAIQLAEAPPVLLDLVTLLDFPERPRWEQIVQAYNLTPPPPLRLTSAEAVNKAYADERPLENLLRSHRRLALVRAPLRDRINLLRQLNQMDRTNPAWPEQIGLLERARHQQIESAVGTALQSHNLNDLFGLWEELRNPDWQAPPPGPLVERVADEVKRHNHERNVQLLESTSVDLARAHATRDRAEALKLRDQWLRVSSQIALLPEDPASRRVAPALRWLADLEQREAAQVAFQNDVGRLEAAIVGDPPASAAELERLYEAVESHGRGVPDDLEARYQDRLNELAARAGQWEKIVLALTFGAGVLGLIALIVHLSR